MGEGDSLISEFLNWNLKMKTISHIVLFSSSPVLATVLAPSINDMKSNVNSFSFVPAKVGGDIFSKFSIRDG